ncbi:GNAT family N-acetyltransferase [Holzapfeliella sp. JNUCC 72]
MVVIKQTKEVEKKQLVQLYNSVNWTSYTQNTNQLESAVKQSLAVFTAWDGQKLVGLVRAVGDGETILYVQDVLVHPNYQGQKIGTKLLKQLLEQYRHVRQKVLLAEDIPELHSFYEKQGFEAANQGMVVGFYKEY